MRLSVCSKFHLYLTFSFLFCYAFQYFNTFSLIWQTFLFSLSLSLFVNFFPYLLEKFYFCFSLYLLFRFAFVWCAMRIAKERKRNRLKIQLESGQLKRCGCFKCQVILAEFKWKVFNSFVGSVSFTFCSRSFLFGSSSKWCHDFQLKLHFMDGLVASQMKNDNRKRACDRRSGFN